MIGLSFDNKRYKEKISYSVGTPMGAYSSWATSAIAHHFMLYLCCSKLGIPWEESKYTLLGDDILIGDTPLANEYLDLTRKLGMEVAEAKSHTSNHFAEFAKRLKYKDAEVTPFPISALKEVSRRYYLLVNLFEVESVKGYPIGGELALNIQAISLYHRIVLGFSSKYCRSLSTKVAPIWYLLKYFRGAMSAKESISGLSSFMGYPHKLEIPDENYEAIMNMMLCDYFQKSLPEHQRHSQNSDVPLGELATRLVMHMTSDYGIHLIDLISQVPILNIHGQITELYGGLRQGI